MDDMAVGEEFDEAIQVPPAYQTHPVLRDMSTLRGELGPALAELPNRQRQVLSLRYFAGLDEIDVSDALAISVKAVRKHAADGIADLRARGVIREGDLLFG